MEKEEKKRGLGMQIFQRRNISLTKKSHPFFQFLTKKHKWGLNRKSTQ